jgi:hypothetical protein
MTDLPLGHIEFGPLPEDAIAAIKAAWEKEPWSQKITVVANADQQHIADLEAENARLRGAILTVLTMDGIPADARTLLAEAMGAEG